MSDQLQELSVFVRAAETGSFSKTAREFSLSQPSVSRMVASLEARLGVKLLLRTTRRVTPTDAGAVFLERTRRVLGDLDEAAHAARGRQPPRCAARRHVRRVRHPRSDSAPAGFPGASSAVESRVRHLRSDRRPGGRGGRHGAAPRPSRRFRFRGAPAGVGTAVGDRSAGLSGAAGCPGDARRLVAARLVRRFFRLA